MKSQLKRHVEAKKSTKILEPRKASLDAMKAWLPFEFKISGRMLGILGPRGEMELFPSGF